MKTHMPHSNEPESILRQLVSLISGSILALLLLLLLEGIVLGLFLDSLKNAGTLTFILISLVANAVVVLSTVFVFALAIKKLSEKISDIMKSAASGDFSINMNETEFKAIGRISSHINKLFEEVRTIIKKSHELTNSLVDTIHEQNSSFNEATSAINEIAHAVNEIAQGASKQAEEARSGVEMVGNLSSRIAVVNESYGQVIKETENVKNVNKEGLASVETLFKKSDEYTAASNEIFTTVENLIESLENISVFVESIQSIAEQTNLLALNAAIEAARAGDAGKGFAVVAEEVRKLADGSRKSTEKINRIIDSIHHDTYTVVDAMKKMKSVSNEQNVAVSQTNESFKKISFAVETIVSRIREVQTAMTSMEKDKNNVEKAIEVIYSVSENTAAASEEVSAATESQLTNFDNLRDTSSKLRSLSDELEIYLKKFKV